MATKKIQMLDYNIKQSENSDTLDGKHASDFASASDMTTAKSNIGELQTKVGDKSVSSQISTAIASKADTGHTHTKSEVGLGNVDNTADADKSVKYATSAGSAASVTGVVDFAHGGTGRTNRDSGYSALMSGGTYTGNLNDCQNCGTYVFSTDHVTNYPSGVTGWAFLEVQTYSRDSSDVLQTATYTGSNKKFSRTHISGNWSPWQENLTMQDAYKQNFKLIPSGADLNDDTYRQNGVYVSASSSNEIKNLPLFYGSKGAFTLVVTGISNSSYTTQIFYSISDPPNIYVRNQYNWQAPWVWTDWHRLIDEFQTSALSIAELNRERRDVEAGLKINRGRSRGNKYTRLYEADDNNAMLSIAQSLPGSGSEGITRLAYNGSYAALRGDIPLYLGEYFAPIARFYFSDYGSSLPSAGNKGRVFFKKV